MPTELTLNTDDDPNGGPRVIAVGEVDLSNIDVFNQALVSASAGTRRPITVDLSAVEYLDSAGISALFNHADEVDRLHLIVNPVLVRALTISGLNEVADVETAQGPEPQVI